jgi:hypothetical protein
MLLLRNFLLITGALILVWFGGHAVVMRLAPDDALIRWRIESMVDGFNDSTVRPVIAGFAPEYEDETSGYGREDVLQVLRGMFFTEREQGTGKFLFRVEVPEDSISIELDEDAGTARVTLLAHFFRRRGGAEEPYWDAAIDARMADVEGGWRFTRSIGVNHWERADAPRSGGQ